MDHETVFNELLTERNVPSTASWQHAVKLISTDPRYELFKHHPERKQMFNQYKIQRSKEEKEEQRMKIKKARENLENLLQNHEKINSNTRYRQAQDLLGNLDAWKSVAENDRREIFRDVIEHLVIKERERTKQLRKRNMKRLSEILDGMTLVTFKTKWEEAQQLLLDNPVFSGDTELLGMDKEDALIVFEDHIRALEKVEEEERKREKLRVYRRERKNREEFVKLLDELHSSGRLTLTSKWCALFPDISGDRRFTTMFEQPLTGSTALDLFKFYIEDLRNRYEDEKVIIRDILSRNNFELKLDTTFESYVNILSTDDRSVKLDDSNVKLVFNRMIEKLKEKEKERLHEESKRRKKLESAFMSLLHSVEPAVDEKAVWDQVRKAISDDDAFLAIPSEEERINLFKSYINTMQESCSHHHAKSRSKKRHDKRKESKSKRRSRSSSFSSLDSSPSLEEKYRPKSHSRSRSQDDRGRRSTSRRKVESRSISRSYSRSPSSDRSSSDLERRNGRDRRGGRRRGDDRDGHRSRDSRREKESSRSSRKDTSSHNNGRSNERRGDPSPAKETSFDPSSQPSTAAMSAPSLKPSSDSEASDIEELERQRRMLLQQLAAHNN